MPITQAEIDLAIELGQAVLDLLNGSKTANAVAKGIQTGNAWMVAHGGTPVPPAPTTTTTVVTTTTTPLPPTT